MAENKTKPTQLKVSDFIAGIEDKVKRDDCRELMKLMAKITGNRAKMWGTAIVGYGKYHYKYESGREGDFFLTGFFPHRPHRPGFDHLYSMGQIDRIIHFTPAQAVD